MVMLYVQEYYRSKGYDYERLITLHEEIAMNAASHRESVENDVPVAFEFMPFNIIMHIMGKFSKKFNNQFSPKAYFKNWFLTTINPFKKEYQTSITYFTNPKIEKREFVEQNRPAEVIIKDNQGKIIEHYKNVKKQNYLGLGRMYEFNERRIIRSNRAQFVAKDIVFLTKTNRRQTMLDLVDFQQWFNGRSVGMIVREDGTGTGEYYWLDDPEKKPIYDSNGEKVMFNKPARFVMKQGEKVSAEKIKLSRHYQKLEILGPNDDWSNAVRDIIINTGDRFVFDCSYQKVWPWQKLIAMIAIDHRRDIPGLEEPARLSYGQAKKIIKEKAPYLIKEYRKKYRYGKYFAWTVASVAVLLNEFSLLTVGVAVPLTIAFWAGISRDRKNYAIRRAANMIKETGISFNQNREQMFASLKDSLTKMKKDRDAIKQLFDSFKDKKAENTTSIEEISASHENFTAMFENVIAQQKDFFNDIDELYSLLSTMVEELDKNIEIAHGSIDRDFDVSYHALNEVNRETSNLLSVNKEIESIIDLINDIAEKLNMLGINAQVQSAKLTGIDLSKFNVENNKELSVKLQRMSLEANGFAVVAKEISKLAENVKNSLVNILKNLERSSEIVKNVYKKNIEMNESLSQTRTNINNTLNKFKEEFAEIPKKAEIATGKINKKAIEISLVSDEIASGSLQMGQTLEQMSQLVAQEMAEMEEKERELNLAKIED